MGMNQEDATSKRDSLPLRLGTAAAGIPVLALAIWLGGIPLLLVTGAAAVVAIWELRALLRRFGLMPWLLSSLAVATFLASGIALREADDGLAWLSYAILITFASDTAAYAVGRLVGRHRLAPTISPGKTWEGAVGGIIGAAAVSAVFALFIELDSLPLIAATLLGAGLSVLGQLGDLTESWLKRKAGVKDSGNLLPGHGGILDRLDSLLPILPAVFVYVTIVTTME